jgi:subtilisin family serine protease
MINFSSKKNRALLLSFILPALFLFALYLFVKNISTAQADNLFQTGEKIGFGVLDALRSQGKAKVVIALIPLDITQIDRSSLDEIRNDIAGMQDKVLLSLKDAHFSVTHKYQAVPALAGEIFSERSLNDLAAHPLVAKIDLDVGGTGSLGTSVPLIGADSHHAVGNKGNGIVVAVLDSGLDTDHSDLSEALIHQECFLDGDGYIDGVGFCPNGSDRQSGVGAAEDDAGHGSHVTGIIASRGHQSAVGVAPGVSIVSIKVTTGPSFAGTFYYFSEVVAALDFIINNRPDVQIINMSLVTYAQFEGDCDNSTSWNMAGASAINTLRSTGVSSFASSGNNGSGTLMSSPACLSNVISVGATNNSDVIASFTDSNASTDIFAPGVGIVSSAIGNTTVSVSGTSMASPHAAGCAALLIASGEAITPDQIETRLETSPVQIYNPKNGNTYPRIDCSFTPNHITDVEISGPVLGFAGDSISFTAVVSPITATIPITYTWQADEQIPLSISNGISSTASFSWQITGTKTITVSAANIGSEAENYYSIQIFAHNPVIYLPLMIR